MRNLGRIFIVALLLLAVLCVPPPMVAYGALAVFCVPPPTVPKLAVTVLG